MEWVFSFWKITIFQQKNGRVLYVEICRNHGLFFTSALIVLSHNDRGVSAVIVRNIMQNDCRHAYQ